MKKRILFALIALAPALTHAAFMTAPSLTAQTSSNAKSSSETPAPSQSHDINPSAAPIVSHGADFFANAAFIYWNVKMEGLAYAGDGRAAVGTAPPATFSRGSTKDVTADCQPGFKVGAGLNFKRDGWDLFLNYTWLNPASHHDSAERHLSHGSLRTEWVVPILANSSPIILPLLSAHNHWKMTFNVLDVELGRSFYISSKLTTRPFIGCKAAWLTQHNHVKYTIDLTNLNIPNVPSNANIKMKQDFVGFGLRGGVNTAWEFANHWSIYGNLAVSLLWCEFEDSRKDTQITNALKAQSSSFFTTLNVKEDFHSIRPVLEMALGLMYSHDFYQGKSRLIVYAGWEEQFWYKQNEFIAPVNLTSGDLTLQGLTTGIGYAF
ncbi:MAG: hypothetical protein JSR57_11825 [Verrucomicrobia bacterium]|nr:hypothetical protein [Verrucomicrobiota bacterium]